MSKPHPALLPHKAAIPAFLDLIENRNSRVSLAETIRSLSFAVRVPTPNFKRDWFRWRNGEVMPGLSDFLAVYQASKIYNLEVPPSAEGVIALIKTMESLLADRREKHVAAVLPTVERFIDRSIDILFTGADALDKDHSFSIPIVIEAFCVEMFEERKMNLSTRVSIVDILRKYADSLEKRKNADEDPAWDA